VSLFQDRAGLVQPGEEGSLPPGPPPDRQFLFPGNGLGPLGQPFGTEQFAPDGPRPEILTGVGSSGGEAGKEAGSERDSRGDLGGTGATEAPGDNLTHHGQSLDSEERGIELRIPFGTDF
jgi:hypothetical protein